MPALPHTYGPTPARPAQKTRRPRYDPNVARLERPAVCARIVPVLTPAMHRRTRRS